MSGAPDCHHDGVNSGLSRDLRRDAIFVIVLAVLMVSSRQFTLPGSTVAVLWPAAGASLLWLHERRLTRARTLVPVLVILTMSVVIRLVTGGGGWDSLLIGLGHTTQAWVSALLLTRRNRPAVLRSPGDLGGLLVVVAVGAVAGAVVAGPALWLVPDDGSPLGWLAAWTARNAAGAITVTAFGLLLRGGRWYLRRDLARPTTWLALVLLAGGVLVFERLHVPLAFTVLPVLAWLALQVRTVTALAITGVVSVAILLLDLRGVGPYAGTGPALHLLYLQLVFVVLGALVLTLSLYRDQRDRLLAQVVSAHRASRTRAEVLERETNVDPLTGAANRRGLASLVGSRPLEPGSYGLLYLDLDRFKLVNDRYGHAAGDAVLVEVTHRITHEVRGTDVVCRLGGDEFAVVCRGITAEALRGLAQRLVATVSRPIPVGTDEVSVGASIGITLARTGDDLDSLLARADRAMYEAKAAGRGRVATD